MRVFCCQPDIAWEDKPANYARVRSLLATAEIAEGSLIVLPEMFATGFSMNVAGIAEDPSGETAAFLSRLAAEHRAYVLGGLATRGPFGKGRNEAVVFTPEGRQLARYCKMHPFTFGGEARHYESGRSPVLFPCGEFTAAPFLCYDLRFPEVFRGAVRRGAQLFLVIANWPQAREEHWITLLRARAIENQAGVVGVNRCGRDPFLAYSGRSMVIDPRGEILADAGNEEGVLPAELDLPALLAYRREFPALEDIHPDYLHAEP